MKDRDDLKRGKKIIVEEKESDKLIFRKLFVDDKDELIALIILNFFKAIKKKWTYPWNNESEGMILNRTTGFIAFMKYLKPVYLFLKKQSVTNDIDFAPTENQFFEVINNISLEDKDFTKDEYKPGNSGISGLYHKLIALSNFV